MLPMWYPWYVDEPGVSWSTKTRRQVRFFDLFHQPFISKMEVSWNFYEFPLGGMGYEIGCQPRNGTCSKTTPPFLFNDREPFMIFMSYFCPLLEYTHANPVVASGVSDKLFYTRKRDTKCPRFQPTQHHGFTFGFITLVNWHLLLTQEMIENG